MCQALTEYGIGDFKKTPEHGNVARNGWRQEPITRSMQLAHIPVTAFSQTDRPIFSLNLTRIQTTAGTSVTNYKHGLNFMYLVFYYVDMCK